MKIAAKKYYRKGELLPFVSWKIDSVTTFGDHQVEFDLPSRQVVRSTGGDSEVIAHIHDGYKGALQQNLWVNFGSGRSPSV
jgi:hypothetical protein